MIAPASDYLLLREIAPLAGIGPQVLRRMVRRQQIPAQFVLKTGLVRPVVRIHRAWLDHLNAPKPAVACETRLLWRSQ